MTHQPAPCRHRRRRIHAIAPALTLGAVLFFPSVAGAYVNPISGLPRAGVVLRAFDNPEHDWLPGHRGVDLPLEIGAAVLSPEEGVVAFVGIVVGTPTVSITHPDGVRTTYQPVHATVTTGEVLTVGQQIGTLGHPTTAYPGLQWGAKIGEDYTNPIRLLPAPSIRLKPLTPVGGPV